MNSKSVKSTKEIVGYTNAKDHWPATNTAKTSISASAIDISVKELTREMWEKLGKEL